MTQLLLLGALLLIFLYGMGAIPRKSSPRSHPSRNVMIGMGLLLVLLLAVSPRLAGILPLLGILIILLFRCIPLWRQIFHVHSKDRTGEAPAPPGKIGPMSKEEAYEILGLVNGASRQEVIAAHRRLMQRMHPDRGGTNYLAGKINQARDTLIGA
ncbi:MAG: molecular chaperone DnaJ [Methylococcaceae bacterium]|nr:molecular chaperone DnaJ [Methylococcaceae bacterium]